MIQYKGDETTSKLILLYILDKVECKLTEDSIIEMCYFQNKWITYFTCKIALSDLDKSGYIEETKSSLDQEKYYTITPEGRSCLSFFYNDIPTSIRSEISKFTEEHKLELKRKQEYFSDCFKNKDGSYTVILKILDVDVTKLELKISSIEQQKAKEIQKTWKENAGKVYASIFDILFN